MPVKTSFSHGYNVQNLPFHMLSPWLYGVRAKTWDQTGLLARKEPARVHVKQYFLYSNIVKITRKMLLKYSVTTQNSYLNSLKSQKDEEKDSYKIF